MAKLPTAADLGPAQIAGGRPTGSYDVSGFARGAEAIAAGGRALGQGISQAAGDVADVYRKQTEMQVLDAHAGASSELLDLHSKLQESKDYQNLPTQYQEKSKEIVDRWAQTIPDGRMREHYLATSGEALARGQASVDHMSFTGMASTDADARKATGLDIESKIGQDPTNAFLPEALKGFGLRVDKAVDAGWITKEQGALEKRDMSVKVAIRTNEYEQEQDPHAWLASKGLAPRTTKASVWATVDKAAQENGISPGGAARLVQIESGGNSNARTGSYYGLTQLSQSEFSKYNRIPGANILDPEANLAAGFAKVKAEGDQFAEKTGHQPTDFDRYMIHQQGMAGYESHLAKPDAPAWQNMLSTGEGRQKGERWAKAAIWGNIPDQYKRQFGGVDNVTSADFLKMWAAKYGAAAPTFAEQTVGINPGRAPGESTEDHTGFANLDPLTRLKLTQRGRTLAQQRSNDAMQATNAQSVQTYQSYDRMLIDAAAGRGAMPPRELLEVDPHLNEGNRNTLLTKYDAANKQDASFQSFMARFNDPALGPFNPLDKNEKDNADKAYQNLGGGDPEKEAPALQAVLDRTGIVPPSAAKAMAGALVSGNAERVGFAAQTAANMMQRNDQIFAGVEGGAALAKAGVEWNHFSEYFGADKAAQKIIERASPEYKSGVLAKIKDEDVGKLIKDKLSVSDLQKEFNQGYTFLGRPQADFNEKNKDVAFKDYAELFKESYMDSGDVDLAKKQALQQMKTIWGVTHFDGSSNGVLMRFAPENAPAYAGIPDLSKRIADQAAAAIKAETGQDVPRDKIMLAPTERGQTAQAYFAGQAPPYLLSWRDKDGAPHYLNPGRAFVFDGHAERHKISEEHRLGLEKATVGAEDFATAIAGQGEAPLAPAGGAGLKIPSLKQAASAVTRPFRTPASSPGADLPPALPSVP